MLNVITVNQDPGVGPNKQKGASVHLLAMRDAFRQQGARVITVDDSHPATVASTLAQYWRTGLDLVYERYALGKSAAARFAAEQQVPYILEVNAPLAWERRRWRNEEETQEERSEDAYMFSHADAIIAVSTEVAKYAVRRGARQSRIKVAANGVDSRLFYPRKTEDPIRRELHIEDKIVLGFHGRLRPWHCFDLLVEVTKRLVDEGEPIFLLAVGNGEFGEALSGSLPSTHWYATGWQPYDEIGRYVAAFDILPLCYREDSPCYFSPLKLIEAMSCGVVPAVPAIGDLASVVQHNCNGLVYPASDVDALIHAIRRLIHDPDLVAKLSNGAKQRATEFSWKRIADFALAFAVKSDASANSIVACS